MTDIKTVDRWSDYVRVLLDTHIPRLFQLEIGHCRKTIITLPDGHKIGRPRKKEVDNGRDKGR